MTAASCLACWPNVRAPLNSPAVGAKSNLSAGMASTAVMISWSQIWNSASKTWPMDGGLAQNAGAHNAIDASKIEVDRIILLIYHRRAMRRFTAFIPAFLVSLRSLPALGHAQSRFACYPAPTQMPPSSRPPPPSLNFRQLREKNRRTSFTVPSPFFKTTPVPCPPTPRGCGPSHPQMPLRPASRARHLY